jgi:hypothetical protein
MNAHTSHECCPSHALLHNPSTPRQIVAPSPRHLSTDPRHHTKATTRSKQHTNRRRSRNRSPRSILLGLRRRGLRRF